MPSSAQTDSVERSSTMRRRIASRRVARQAARCRPARARAPGAARRSRRGAAPGRRRAWPARLRQPSSSSDVVVRCSGAATSTILFLSTAVSHERSAARPPKRGAAREHGFDDVVDGVFGERRVAQLALSAKRSRYGRCETSSASEIATVPAQCRQRRDGGRGAARRGRSGGSARGRHSWRIGSGEWRWRHCRRPHVAPASRKITPDHIAVRACGRHETIGHAARLDPGRRRPDRHPRAAGHEPAQRRLRGQRRRRRHGRAGQPERARQRPARPRSDDAGPRRPRGHARRCAPGAARRRS